MSRAKKLLDKIDEAKVVNKKAVPLFKLFDKSVTDIDNMIKEFKKVLKGAEQGKYGEELEWLYDDTAQDLAEVINYLEDQVQPQLMMVAGGVEMVMKGDM